MADAIFHPFSLNGRDRIKPSLDERVIKSAFKTKSAEIVIKERNFETSAIVGNSSFFSIRPKIKIRSAVKSITFIFNRSFIVLILKKYGIVKVRKKSTINSTGDKNEVIVDRSKTPNNTISGSISILAMRSPQMREVEDISYYLLKIQPFLDWSPY